MKQKDITVFVANWLSLKQFGFHFNSPFGLFNVHCTMHIECKFWIETTDISVDVYFLDSVKLMRGENLNVLLSRKYNVCIE